MRGKVTQLWLKRDLIKSSFGGLLFVLLLQSPIHAQSPGGADQEARELERKIQTGGYTDADAQKLFSKHLRDRNVQTVLSQAAKSGRLNTAAESVLVNAIEDESKRENLNWEWMTDLMDGLLIVTAGRGFSDRGKAFLSTFGAEKHESEKVLTLEGISALPLLRGLKQGNLQVKMKQWGFPDVSDVNLQNQGAILFSHKLPDRSHYAVKFTHFAAGARRHERSHILVSFFRREFTYEDGAVFEDIHRMENYIAESQAVWINRNKRRIARQNREAAKKAREAIKKVGEGESGKTKNAEGVSPAELDQRIRDHVQKTGESAGETREKKKRGSKKPKSGEAK